jgi:hypothetical protein
LPPALSHLSTTGILRFEPCEALESWIQTAISSGLITVSRNEYRTLSLTAEGRRFMQSGSPDVRIVRPATRHGSRSRYDRLVGLARRSRWDDDPDDEEELLEAMMFRRRPDRWRG